MVCHALEDLQFDVGQGTDGQRHALPRQAVEELHIFVAAHAVIDAPHLQDVQGFADIGRRSLFARVRHGRQALAQRPREHLGEFRRGVAGLRRIQSDGGEQVFVRQDGLQGVHRIRGAQVPQEAGDQTPADAELRLPLEQRPVDAAEHRIQSDAARNMGLGVAEYLHVHDTLFMRLAQVGSRQRMKIVGVAQHVGTGIIDVQEGL